MKIKVISIFLFLLVSISAIAQDADALIGKWQSGHGTARLQISKRGNHYFGKIIWLQEPNEDGKPKVDRHNPLEELKSKPILGLEIFKGFIFSGNNIWNKGKIYDPKTGNTFNGQLGVHDDKLNIRAFFGLSVLGRTEVWTRVE